MADKPRIAIVGAGNLGTPLATALRRASYRISVVLARRRGSSLRTAANLAKEVGAAASADPRALDSANLVWFCVPDSAIAKVATSLSRSSPSSAINWRGKIILHSSGALTSDELAPLRQRGASVASVHPLMTFVRGSRPSLEGVPFAIEGGPAAVRTARRIVRDLGGLSYPIRKREKAAYHAWGTFASPLFIALLATTERVAQLAGVNRVEAKRRMIPILLQTLANYASFDAADAFSGPIIRGDVDTVKRHLRVLHDIPAARNAYVALALSACQFLPAKNKAALSRILNYPTGARGR